MGRINCASCISPVLKNWKSVTRKNVLSFLFLYICSEVSTKSKYDWSVNWRKNVLSFLFLYLCSEVSTKSKYDWSVNWRRNFLVNMYSSLLRGEFFPNPPEKHETRSKCDQEVELSHQSTIPSLKTSCFHRRSLENVYE